MDSRYHDLLVWAADDGTPPVLDLQAIEKRAGELRRRRTAHRSLLALPVVLVLGLVALNLISVPGPPAATDRHAPVIAVLGTVQLEDERYVESRLGATRFEEGTLRISKTHDRQQYGAVLTREARGLCMFRFDERLALGTGGCVEAAQFGPEDFMIRRFRSDAAVGQPWSHLAFLVGDGITQIAVGGELIAVHNNVVVVDDSPDIGEVILFGPMGSRNVVLPEYPSDGSVSALNSR